MSSVRPSLESGTAETNFVPEAEEEVFSGSLAQLASVSSASSVLDGGAGAQEEGGFEFEPLRPSRCTCPADFARLHFWEHHARLVATLQKQEQEREELVAKDPLSPARRSSDPGEARFYSFGALDAHIVHQLEEYADAQKKLLERSPTPSSNVPSEAIASWLQMVFRDQAAMTIQAHWRRYWRRKNGIPCATGAESLNVQGGALRSSRTGPGSQAPGKLSFPSPKGPRVAQSPANRLSKAVPLPPLRQPASLLSSTQQATQRRKLPGSSPPKSRHQSPPSPPHRITADLTGQAHEHGHSLEQQQQQQHLRPQPPSEPQLAQAPMQHRVMRFRGRSFSDSSMLRKAASSEALSLLDTTRLERDTPPPPQQQQQQQQQQELNFRWALSTDEQAQATSIPEQQSLPRAHASAPRKPLAAPDQAGTSIQECSNAISAYVPGQGDTCTGTGTLPRVAFETQRRPHRPNPLSPSLPLPRIPSSGFLHDLLTQSGLLKPSSFTDFPASFSAPSPKCTSLPQRLPPSTSASRTREHSSPSSLRPATVSEGSSLSGSPHAAPLPHKSSSAHACRAASPSMGSSPKGIKGGVPGDECRGSGGSVKDAGHHAAGWRRASTSDVGFALMSRSTGSIVTQLQDSGRLRTASQQDSLGRRRAASELGQTHASPPRTTEKQGPPSPKQAFPRSLHASHSTQTAPSATQCARGPTQHWRTGQQNTPSPGLLSLPGNVRGSSGPASSSPGN